MIFKFYEETVSVNSLFMDGSIDLAAKGYNKDRSVFWDIVLQFFGNKENDVD